MAKSRNVNRATHPPIEGTRPAVSRSRGGAGVGVRGVAGRMVAGGAVGSVAEGAIRGV